MTQIQDHESSPYTQTRTQKSPPKNYPLTNMRSNYSTLAHHSNIEIAFMKLKQQAKRDSQNYIKQIQILKDELFRRNQQLQYLKSNVIINLKKDLNDAQRDNIKNFKQSEKQARQIQKLRADNFNMQQDLQKQLKQRRTYVSKLDDLKQIKQATRRQIMQKDKIIRNYSQQNRKLQKELATYKAEIQDLNDQINDRDKRLFQSESEYKAILQKSFIIESELKGLQLKQRDNDLMVNTYREKINELERQKEDLLDRIQQQTSRNEGNSQRMSNVNHSQMLQVKSLMDQIYNLVDEKKGETKQVKKRFLASIACLQRAVSSK